MVGNIGDKIRALTPRQTIGIMTLVTLLVPFQSMMRSFGYSAVEGWQVRVTITSIFWEYSLELWNDLTGALQDWSGAFLLIEPSMILGRAPSWIPHLVFAVLMIRFRQDRVSKRLVLGAGLLTVALPILMALGSYLYLLNYFGATGLLIYVGPLPIQLIIGLLLARYSEYWERDKLWGQKEDMWWE